MPDDGIDLGTSRLLNPELALTFENTSVTNNIDGTFLVCAGSTFNFVQGMSNAGLLDLMDASATVEGGMIDNSGTISGEGTLNNTIDNSGTISAGTPGVATFPLLLTGAVTNESEGIISAVGGGVIKFSDFTDNEGLIHAYDGGEVAVQNNPPIQSGVPTSFINDGSIDLDNGTFSTGTEALTNNGTISGSGTLESGDITSTGAISFTGGASSVTGALDVAGGTVDTYASTTFNSDVTVNGGTFTSHSAPVAITGTLTVNSGTYENDAGTTSVGAMSVGPQGKLIGDPGARFQVKGNVDNASKTGFLLAQATLEFIANSNNSHVFTWSVDTGTLDLGTFTIDSGQSIDFENGGNDLAALDVGAFKLDEPITSSVEDEIDQYLTNNLTIYYDPAVAANEYLDGQDYTFGNGGQLIAATAPEPSSFALAASGLLLLVGLRRVLCQNSEVQIRLPKG